MFLYLFFSASIYAKPSLQETLEKVEQVTNPKPVENCTETTCHDESKIGCAQQFDLFCDKLYSKKNKGNMDVPLTNGDEINIRFAKNEKNVTHIFAAYNEAKIKYRENLPADLKTELAKNNYFEKFEKYTSAVNKKSIRGNLEESARWSEINSIWTTAITRVALDRTEKIIPNYGNKGKTTFEEDQKYEEIKSQLRVEINASIWENSPQWKRIRGDFKTVKQEFLEYIASNKSLSEATRKKMLAKIKTITLALPGTDVTKIDDHCAQVEVNASYNMLTNEVTICAGMFNIPTIAILAHEIAHSIDPHRLLADDLNNSSLAKQYEKYLKKSCGKNKPSCKEWQQLKNKLANFDLKRTPHYSEEYLQCLRQKELLPWPKDSTLVAIVEGDAGSYIDFLAQKNGFLNLVAPKKDTYMNVCRFFDLKREKFNFRAPTVTALAFINEFQCSSEKNEADKLRSAVKEAKSLASKFQNNMLNFEGALTEYSIMLQRGYSTSLGEKVADNIGLNIAAKIVKEQVSNIEDRRSIIFSATSSFCDGLSSAADHPELATAEKEFSTEEHSANYKRRRELMTNDIRQALSCEKDFKIKDCSL